MESALLSSRFALALAVGVGGYMGGLHLWLWRSDREERAHAWVAAWCGACVAAQLARLVQMETADPRVALHAARALLGFTTLLALCLLGFTAALERPRRGLAPGTWAAHLLLALACVGTPLFFPEQSGRRTDWFGHEYLGVPARPLTLLYLPYALGVFAWVVTRLRRAAALEPVERRTLEVSFAIFLAMAVQSLFASLRWMEAPPSMQYGPLVVAVGLSMLLVKRQTRLRTRLEAVVAERTAEIERAAERAAESEERYRRLVEDAPLGVIACDREGRVRTVNPALLRILGSPSAELTRRINLLGFEPLVRAGFSDALRTCMEQGTPVARDITYRSIWGRTADVHVNIAPLRDAAGAILGAQAILEDVSERRRLEHQVRQSQRMQAVGHLAAGMAHEINNPMAFVRSNLNHLREEWAFLLEEVREGRAGADTFRRLGDCQDLLEDSLEGVDRTVAIVRDMNEFSRSGSEGRGRLDLNDLVESTIRVAGPHLEGQPRIERHYAELPPVFGSAHQIQQVVLNLLINASHAIQGAGTIRVSTEVEGDRVCLRVEDDGCGIPEDVLDHLFDPFFTTKAVGKGTGLGLYVSYEIVRGHGGELRVRSVPGEGSVFEVWLPTDRRSPED